MAWREAGGMLKLFVTLVFIELPCWTENVWSWANMVLKIIVHANIGTIEIRVLTCSTWFIVHSFHGFSLWVVLDS